MPFASQALTRLGRLSSILRPQSSTLRRLDMFLVRSELTESRPWMVTAAVVLLVANLLACTAYDLLSTNDEQEITRDMKLILYGVHGLSIAIELTLIVLIANAVNWARYAYAAIVLLVVVSYWFISGSTGSDDRFIETMVYWLSLLLQVAATTLIFTKSASGWFKRVRQPKSEA
jgi:hypothetical protein